MKSFLAKFAIRKAIGVYVGEQEVAICKLAATPLGPVEIASCRQTYTPEQLDAVLKELLMPLLGRRKRFPIPVALGLSGQRVYFSSRPIVKTDDTDASPQVLLHEVLQSSAISVDEMVLDLVKSQPDSRQVASIVACRRKYVAGMLEALQGCGVNPFRAEPAPCALLRLAVLRHRAPRRARTVLRIFLGESQGLAMLAVANTPFVWRYFAIPRGEEAAAIISVVRILQTLSKRCGVESAVHVVMIHCRTDLRGLVGFEELEQQAGVRVVWSEEPKLSESSVAFGLALGCLKHVSQGFDLARTIKPRASLWELFPWGETALQASLLACLGLFLADRSRTLNETYEVARAEDAKHDWAGALSEQDLQKQKKALEQKVEAVRKFLGSRVVWTSYTHDIPTRLPVNASMSAFEGVCELEATGKKKEGGIKAKKSFILRFAAPIRQDGSMPEEIDDFLESLRDHPLLKRDFPIVELADLKWFQPFNGSKPVAYFTVVCLPKTNKGATKPSPDEEKKGQGKAD